LLGLSSIESPDAAVETMMGNGRGWLERSQNQDGGWGGDAGVASSIEETSLAVQALATNQDMHEQAASRGVRWLLEATDEGKQTPPTPIGFYFAKLWYFEKLYPLIFLVGALGAVARRFERGQAPRA
jgi:squalene-hopene/tetraprenyl-beta-curcumene cyclase